MISDFFVSKLDDVYVDDAYKPETIDVLYKNIRRFIAASIVQKLVENWASRLEFIWFAAVYNIYIYIKNY